MKKIVLASSSPRRKEILDNLGISYNIKTLEIKETIDENLTHSQIVKSLSYQKALSVKDLVDKNSIIIGADTIVTMKDKIFIKPKNENDAFDMLKTLSGNKHTVYTGLTIIDVDSNNVISTYEKTNVFMDNITDAEIRNYIKTKEWIGKAGAYGIQGIASLFIKRIEGDYFNVVGLPIRKLYEGLDEIGINLLKINVNYK